MGRREIPISHFLGKKPWERGWASADSKILLIDINFCVSKLKTNGHDFLRFGESLSINYKVVLKFHIGLLPSYRAVILFNAIFPKIDSLV